ncbi:MAG: hypothetical protein US51_C0005G0016, partial [Microgenomates group bacterium GW2011_GWA2_37_6]
MINDQKKSLTGFKPVSPQVNFPQIEEEILSFWK